MGRKVNFFAALAAVTFFLSGCAEFQLHVRKDAENLKPSVILIGQFEMRNMNYDPYVADEFRNALKYEFFRKGYNPVTVQNAGTGTLKQSESAVKICSDYSGDILITGIISQREKGFLAERETDTLITFTVYMKDGAIMGEGYYYDDRPAGEEALRRSAAGDFVSELIGHFGR